MLKSPWKITSLNNLIGKSTNKHLPGLVNIEKAIENDPVEIVSFPISMVIFHSCLYAYQRVYMNFSAMLNYWKVSYLSQKLYKHIWTNTVSSFDKETDTRN